METLRYERDGAVGWLRLNRPERLNAMTMEMWAEMAELGSRLRDDTDVRCLVVTGEGRAFSSGIDVAALMNAAGSRLFGEAGSGAAPPADTDGDPLVRTVAELQEAFAWLAEVPYPTVAAVRGYALGGGMQLALACDLRLVARGTTLGLLEQRYGLLPDLGGTFWLPRVVGPARAKELILTGETVDADEALRIGLANRVVDDADLDGAAAALAGKLAAQPPLAVRGAKRAVDAAATQTLRENLHLAAVAQAACIRSADFLEAIRSTAERRTPEYHGR